MATGDELRFRTETAVSIPTGRLTAVELAPDGTSDHLHWDGGVVFDSERWYEVLLRVDWPTEPRTGTRFSHTKIPDQEPLHSEAINAEVLAQLSDGRQLLRGNSLFGPDRTTKLVLEVWHDAAAALDLTYAELVVRELCVPWPS